MNTTKPALGNLRICKFISTQKICKDRTTGKRVQLRPSLFQLIFDEF
jgi:hypothetical protein